MEKDNQCLINNQEFNLRDVQMVGLDILIEFRNFCERHNLRYYLYCGTLLGCIRHGGFIPWDDDVDVAMPLRDYNRFLKLYSNEHDEKYDIYSIDTDPSCRLPWIKVGRKGSLYYDKQYENTDVYKEIGIDIYPMIGAFSNQAWAKVQVFLLKAQKVLLRGTYDKHIGGTAKDGHLVLHNIIDLMPRRFRVWLAKLIRLIVWIDPKRCETIGTIDAARFSGKYKRKDWNDMQYGTFEDEQFIIPKEYDLFLRTMYGDYMKLPPEYMRQLHVSGDIVCFIP